MFAELFLRRNEVHWYLPDNIIDHCPTVIKFHEKNPMGMQISNIVMHGIVIINFHFFKHLGHALWWLPYVPDCPEAQSALNQKKKNPHRT